MRCEWFFNGFPLKVPNWPFAVLSECKLFFTFQIQMILFQHSSRYRMSNDFGFVSLDIDYIIADDEGEYTLRVSNEAGQAESQCQIQVGSSPSALGPFR